MSIIVTQYQQRLEYLFNKVGNFSCDDELLAHWARYLCILTSGFLEVSIREIYGEYARTKAAPNVANFVSDQLRRFQNPNMDKILRLTRSFSSEWGKNLENGTQGELKASVDSIVANRHNIAHGVPVGITYGAIKRYYENAKKVIDMIINQCAT